MNTDMEQLQKALSDEALVRGLLSAGSAEEAQGMLEAQGVSLSGEELTELGDMLNRLMEGDLSDEEKAQFAESSELSEEELASVAGGSWLTWDKVKWGVAAIAAVAICTVAGVAISRSSAMAEEIAKSAGENMRQAAMQEAANAGKGIAW